MAAIQYESTAISPTKGSLKPDTRTSRIVVSLPDLASASCTIKDFSTEMVSAFGFSTKSGAASVAVSSEKASSSTVGAGVSSAICSTVACSGSAMSSAAAFSSTAGTGVFSALCSSAAPCVSGSLGVSPTASCASVRSCASSLEGAGAFSVHFATSLRSSVMGVLKLNRVSFSVNQPEKAYPSHAGSSGSLAFSPSAIFCSLTADPPALSNVTV